MADLLNPNPAPQFSIAEFGNEPKTDTCKMCQKPITATYYRANAAMVCDSCADKVRRNIPQDSHAAFVKAVVFGVGGFLAGLIAYAGLAILFEGFRIGYMALGVGWIVGKAMMAGSGNIGGRRYQIAAVVLTYAAVSMAAIPIALATYSKSSQAQHSQTAKNTSAAGDTSAASASQSEEAKTTPRAGTRQSPMVVFIEALGKLALLGLISPFLEIAEGWGGIIGLVILFVGMRFAWRMTATKVNLSVEGPYQVSNSAAKGTSA
jgi:hypothetical protein